MPDNQIVINNGGSLTNQETYNAVRTYIVAAQKQLNTAVNFAMVTAYWNIGKQIYEACGESERAEYGKNFCSIYRISLLRNLEKVLRLRTLGICDSFSLHSRIATQCVAN